MRSLQPAELRGIHLLPNWIVVSRSLVQIIAITHSHQDPQLNTSKRLARSQAFTESVTHAALERQLASAQAKKMELQTKLREKELLVERLERDRRYFSDREAEEKEEKERDRKSWEEERASCYFLVLERNHHSLLNA